MKLGKMRGSEMEREKGESGWAKEKKLMLEKEKDRGRKWDWDWGKVTKL